MGIWVASHHREGTNLVHLHHVGHRREDAHGIETVAVGLNHGHDLVSQLLKPKEKLA
jgi:hypothetical protein